MGTADCKKACHKKSHCKKSRYKESRGPHERFFRFPYHGAGVALIYENAVFMGRRSKGPFLNRWSVPGGMIERGESPAEASCRELAEETGIRLESLHAQSCGQWSLKFPFFSWTTFFYKVAAESLEVFEHAVPNEFSELKWIRFSELRNYRLRPFTLREFKRFSG